MRTFNAILAVCLLAWAVYLTVNSNSINSQVNDLIEKAEYNGYLRGRNEAAQEHIKYLEKLESALNRNKK